VSGTAGDEPCAVDLDPSESDDALTSISEPILHCDALISPHEDLSSWDTLDANHETNDM